MKGHTRAVSKEPVSSISLGGDMRYEIACEAHGLFPPHLLWVLRFFRWYIAAGCNGSGVTRIEWGMVK